MEFKYCGKIKGCIFIDENGDGAGIKLIKVRAIADDLDIYGDRDSISAGIAGETTHKRIKGGGGKADELGLGLLSRPPYG